MDISTPGAAWSTAVRPRRRRSFDVRPSFSRFSTSVANAVNNTAGPDHVPVAVTRSRAARAGGHVDRTDAPPPRAAQVPPGLRVGPRGVAVRLYGLRAIKPLPAAGTVSLPLADLGRPRRLRRSRPTPDHPLLLLHPHPQRFNRRRRPQPQRLTLLSSSRSQNADR